MSPVTLRKLCFSVPLMAVLCSGYAQASTIYSSATGVNVNGTTTSNLTSVSTASLGVSLTFNASAGGGGGVLLDELSAASIYDAGWHDSQIEVEQNGDVRISVWDNNTIGILNLGSASFGANHTVVLSYDDATGKLWGSLDGVAKSSTSAAGARATPMENGFDLYYAIGGWDPTNFGNNQGFAGTIMNVVISNAPVGGSVPEPSMLALLGLGGLLARGRRAI